ncbi:lytic transglycosylase domain-containing protein [Actinokineospora sp.]|uniref:lytic transglycosylase domain-containing protein n=1 Tax=Actinokineospora sp. TaxID=1872133 RepID=UPI003D6BD287
MWIIQQQRRRCHEFDEDEVRTETLVHYSAVLMAAAVLISVTSTLTTDRANESPTTSIAAEAGSARVEDEVVVTVPPWRADSVIIIPSWRALESVLNVRPADVPDPVGTLVGGVPSIALLAYHMAADDLAEQQPSCGIDWALIAAIGRVESNHGQYGGARFGRDGVTDRPIRGIPLDGRPGVAYIADTDHGTLDGDARYDRAVGPMQFIPSTWRAVFPAGNPDNIFDAAAAAGRYLCAGGGYLRERSARERAVFRYNHSNDYVRLVLDIAEYYATGAFATVESTRPPLIAQAAGLEPELTTPASADQGTAQVTTAPTSAVSAPTTPPTVAVSSTPALGPSDNATSPSTTTPPEQTSGSDPPVSSTEPSSSVPSTPPNLLCRTLGLIC